MLRLENATFQQGDFTLSADLCVADAKVTAVIGPSGAGKSTLLHGIAGFVPLLDGRLSFNGEDLGGKAPGDRPISMLFQDNNLFPHLTLMQNVGLALTTKRFISTDVKERVEDMLSNVGLSGLSGRKPAELSGGQQSRVALARSLLRDSPIILLDEPFSALGPALKDEMLDLSVSLAGHRTVILVTHDPEDARRVADEVIAVTDRKACAPCPTDAFMQTPPKAMRDYFGVR